MVLRAGISTVVPIFFFAGQRACLGEPLALQLVFIYTTALVRAFSMKLFLPGGDKRFQPQAADGDDPTSAVPTMRFEEGRLGFTYSPQPFKIVLTPILGSCADTCPSASNSLTC
jgi:hypothetical protein